MIRRFRLLLLFAVAVAAAVVSMPAGAQVPGLPSLAGKPPAAQAEQPAADPEAKRSADLQALDRVLGLLKDDEQRTAFVQSLEAMRASLAMPGPAAPASEGAKDATADADASINPDGLLGAVAATVSDAAGNLPETALGASLGAKLDAAAAELRERQTKNWGGDATLTFLAWAAGGLGLLGGVTWALFNNIWLKRRRKVRRSYRSRVHMMRSVFGKLPFILLPWLGGVAVIVVWTAAFGRSWRETQLFVALASPVVGAVLARQAVLFVLFLLARSRGWRLINYARAKLLRWVVAVAALGIVSGLMREFAVRVVIGRNVADLVALGLDLAVAALAVAAVVVNRRTVRSLILKGRERENDDRAAGILASVISAFANYWHVFAILFVVANVGARLFGIGGGHFFRDALIAAAYIVAGLLFLALSNAVFSRQREESAARRRTSREAVVVRVMGVLHVAVQVATVLVVAVACIDLWGFGVAEWLATENGARLVRPLAFILVVPLVVWLIWVVVDTVIEEALAPTDNFGRQRQQSARVKTLLPLLRNFIFAALAVITVIAVLANIGVNVAPLLAGAGIIGIAISFGSQQLVQDVITGFFFLFEDAIAIGDVVSTGSHSGVVEGINIRTVRIRGGDGALYSVPFSQIKALQNNSRDFGVYLVEFTVGYASSPDRALAVMREIGDELCADPNFAPQILAPLDVWGVDGFTADGAVIKGAIRCRPLKQWGVGREFNRRLKQRFDREGIVQFTPKQTVAIVDDRPANDDAGDGLRLPAPPRTAANGGTARTA